MRQNTKHLPSFLACLFVLFSQAPAAAQDCSPAQLHAALLEHDKSRIEFQYKMEKGFIKKAGRGDLAIAMQRNAVLYGGPDSTIRAMQSHLRALDASGTTYVLVYEPKPNACVWLVDAAGNVSSAAT